MIKIYSLFTGLFLLLIGCSDSVTTADQSSGEGNTNASDGVLTRFRELSGSETGITFGNHIKEDFRLNYYSYGYMYNGGGVGVGDINNDDLPDIYFIGNMTPNKLYLNEGNLQFEDITASAGVEALKGFKTGVSMIDINNDGHLDLYVCRSGIGPLQDRTNLLYINNGDLTFTESAQQYGLDDQSNTNHANFFDYDLDGDLDIYLLNHPIEFGSNNRPRVRPVGNQYKRLTQPDFPFESDRLYRNDGNGKFADVSKQAGIQNRAFGLSAVVSDFNNDGYPDIFIGNDFIEPDLLYINDKRGGFSDQYQQYFSHVSQNSMGADIADYNNDGLEDLIVLDMMPEDNKRQKSLMNTMMFDRYQTLLNFGYGHQIMRNVLQLNNGNGSYSEVGQLAGISNTDWSWGPLLADFDNDGWKDLFIANGFRRDISDLDFIKFKNDSINKGGGIPISEMKSVYDILNRIPSNKVRNYMYHNSGDLTFQDVSNSWGFSKKTFSNGTAYGDLDNDGDLDLVVNNIDEEVIIYENQSDSIDDNSYLQIELSGPSGNTLGLETRVELKTGSKSQVQVLKTVKGFLSSVQPLLHFGLGNQDKVDRLTVTWPDGKTQLLEDVAVNRRMTLDYKDAVEDRQNIDDSGETLLTDVSGKYGIQFTHSENEFVDFKRERLLPHQLSRLGPCLEVADVNGDGLEDFYIGGAAGSAGTLFIQNGNSNFTAKSTSTWLADKKHEDVAATFFDKDNDGDQDLYVVSGGSAFADGAQLYMDRLYENDGKGNFTRTNNIIPAILHSGGVVAAGDFDNDGDQDLFVGGRHVPGSYPTAPRSYLLENKAGRFSDVTNNLANGLENIGMVSSAIWIDINADDAMDLVLTGEWMPITMLINTDGKLKDQTSLMGLDQTSGWWNTITIHDFDLDGDLDLVAGNMGLNSRFKANANQPVEIYADDFDNSGNIDAIMTCYIQGTSWPVPQKDALIEQMPGIKKKFIKYDKYARATIHDIFTPAELQRAQHLKCQTLESTLFVNEGNNRFSSRALPKLAQVSPVNGIVVEDVNMDGHADLIIAGNNYFVDTESGRYDAGVGLVLTGDSKNHFEPMKVAESGLFIPKDARNLRKIQLSNGKQLLLVANNNDQLMAFEIAAEKIIN